MHSVVISSDKGSLHAFLRGLSEEGCQEWTPAQLIALPWRWILDRLTPRWEYILDTPPLSGCLAVPAQSSCLQAMSLCMLCGYIIRDSWSHCMAVDLQETPLLSRRRKAVRFPSFLVFQMERIIRLHQRTEKQSPKSTLGCLKWYYPSAQEDREAISYIHREPSTQRAKHLREEPVAN